MEYFLAFLGFFSLILMIYLLLKDKTNPATAFIIVSAGAGFLLVLLDTYFLLGIAQFLKNKVHIAYFEKMQNPVFDFKALSFFIKEGINAVSGTAILFIFSILFFGILNEAGIFNTIIISLLKISKNNVYGICILTVIICIIAHLDGSGASSLLIVIPALLPVYEKLKMKKTSLMTIVALSLGVMNLLPWGGPTLRAATIINAEANELWFKLIPIQIIGLFCAFALALFLAKKELAAGASIKENEKIEFIQNFSTQKNNKFILNIILLVAVIILLILGIFPGYFPFILGFCLALLINYTNSHLAQQIIDKYAKSAILMATTLFAAGILIGVFENSGIMKIMAGAILELFPTWALSLIPLLVGISAVPMALIFCTDSYFFGIMPIVISITNNLGIDPFSIAIIMVVARNCGAFISPVVPATLLACGLSGLSIKEHIKKSFFWVWISSFICLIAGSFLNIIHFF